MNTICASCQSVNRIAQDRLHESAKCGRCGHQLFDGEVVNANKETFDQLIKDEMPIVIDFWAPWCRPCVNFTPIFTEVAAERAHQIRCVKINTEQEQELANRFRIRSIPTIMVFQNGEMVDMLSGALPKVHFEQWLDEVLKAPK